MPTFEEIVAELPDPSWQTAEEDFAREQSERAKADEDASFEREADERYPHLGPNSSALELAIGLIGAKRINQAAYYQRKHDPLTPDATLLESHVNLNDSSREELAYHGFYNSIIKNLLSGAGYQSAVKNAKVETLRDINSAWSYRRPLKREIRRLIKYAAGLYLEEAGVHFQNLEAEP